MELTNEQLDAAYRKLIKEGAAAQPNPNYFEVVTMPPILTPKARAKLDISDTEYYAVWGRWYLRREGVDLT